jgi:serine/threonine protein kinase
VAKSIIQQPGNYRLLSQLGRGGFADVYLGEHVYLKTQVAIKVLRVRPDDDTIADFLSKYQHGKVKRVERWRAASLRASLYRVDSSL